MVILSSKVLRRMNYDEAAQPAMMIPTTTLKKSRKTLKNHIPSRPNLLSLYLTANVVDTFPNQTLNYKKSLV